jgi:hypothetical protein
MRCHYTQPTLFHVIQVDGVVHVLGRVQILPGDRALLTKDARWLGLHFREWLTGGVFRRNAFREESANHGSWNFNQLAAIRPHENPVRKTARYQRFVLQPVELVPAPGACSPEICNPGFHIHPIVIHQRMQVFDLGLADPPGHSHLVVPFPGIPGCRRGVEGRFLHIAQVIRIVQMAIRITLIMAYTKSSGISQWHIDLQRFPLLLANCKLEGE